MTNENEPQLNTAFLEGEKVVLRPFEKEDLVHVRKWTNDPEVRPLIGEVMPMNQASAEAWFEKAKNDPDRVWFVIVIKDSGQVIGETGLLRMFHAWRTTDLTIIIGEKSAWGKGYGKEAIKLLMDYAFGSLNFHRIAIGVVSTNERALRFYERAGFRKEGVQRDGYYYDHKYHDFVMMSILEDEFRRASKKG
jgi:diamine N-acetyltransferase